VGRGPSSCPGPGTAEPVHPHGAHRLGCRYGEMVAVEVAGVAGPTVTGMKAPDGSA
jgi:hypothetical protein